MWYKMKTSLTPKGLSIIALSIFTLLTGCLAKPAQPSAPSPTVTPSPAKDPITELVAGMSLMEKIGQMVVVGMEGTQVQPEIISMIKDRHAGGIILFGNNLVTPDQTVQLLNALKQVNQDAGAKLPLLLSADQEGGRVTRLPKEIKAFPPSRTVGNTNEPKYAGRVGSALGKAMKAVGFNMNYAPVMDVNTNPDNPVIGDRAFGITAENVSIMGVQEMLGIKSQGVIPVVKHFPGHGDTSVDSHKGLPVVEHDLERLRSVELVPFVAAIKEEVPVVMVAHILMTKLDPGVPASMSRVVIQDILRGEMHYQGVVITDDMTMEAVGKTMAIGPAAVQAVLAGADLVLVGHDPAQQKAVFDALAEAAQSGQLPVMKIDESVARIAKLKQGFALSDKPTPAPDITELNHQIEEALRR